jgi:hypothetical protein
VKKGKDDELMVKVFKVLKGMRRCLIELDGLDESEGDEGVKAVKVLVGRRCLIGLDLRVLMAFRCDERKKKMRVDIVKK